MSFFGITSKEYADEKGREYYFDNAKFILIFLVVLAHAISPLKADDKVIKTLWTVINAMHMPCLIMISGYFAQSYIDDKGNVKYQRLFTYIIYYLAAQLTVSLFEYFVLGNIKMNKSFFAPRSSLWYLMCLIWWFTLLPLISRLKPKIALGGAIVFGLIVGYDTATGDFLSTMRVFSHFPFFLIGYYFRKEWLYKFRNKITQIIAAAVLILISVWTYSNLDIIPSRIITSNYNYANAALKIFTDKPLMFLNRLIYWIVALILCACFMVLVPRGKALYTKWGSRTLQVYILHRFLYLADLQYEWYAPLLGVWYGGSVMALIALALTVVLSLKPFEYPFKMLGNIKLKWFEKET